MGSFNQKIDYLRLSVTDRCDLRCIYCMPTEGIATRPQAELLTYEEIVRLVKIFVNLGVSKIRLTGGEPLVRRGIIYLIKSLASVEGIEELCLTTNGTLLAFYADELKKAGIKRINISLDTLKESRFKNITTINSLRRVLEGIDKAVEAGFYPIKLNTVVMKGINDDEILDFAEFALSKNLVLRFIEFMKVTPLWREDYFIPIEEIKKVCEKRFRLIKVGSKGSGPADYYEIGDGRILGFINTNEDNCRRCTRLRLTSTGELKLCLYEAEGLCLRSLLRKGIDDEEIYNTIIEEIKTKEFSNYRTCEYPLTYMCSVGG